MSDQALAETFRSIAAEHDWREALRGLVNILKPDQEQFLGDLLNSRNDPLIRLPLETVTQIFQSLPMQSAWTLQLVNRHWHSVLSAPRFLLAMLQRWDTHDPLDAAPLNSLGKGEELDLHAVVHRKLRHLHAMRTGNAFRFQTMDVYEAINFLNTSHLHKFRTAIQGDRIAYLDSRKSGRNRYVIVKSLASPEMGWNLGSREDSEIRLIALTSAFVAYVTSPGQLIYFKLDGLAEKRQPKEGEWDKIQLPSADVTAMAADGDLVVVLAAPKKAPQCREGFLFNMRTRHLQSFSYEAYDEYHVPQPERMAQTLADTLIVDSRARHADIFTATITTDGDSEDDTMWRANQHYRISLDDFTPLPNPSPRCVLSRTRKNEGLYLFRGGAVIPKDFLFRVVPTGHRKIFRFESEEPYKAARSMSREEPPALYFDAERNIILVGPPATENDSSLPAPLPYMPHETDLRTMIKTSFPERHGSLSTSLACQHQSIYTWKDIRASVSHALHGFVTTKGIDKAQSKTVRYNWDCSTILGCNDNVVWFLFPTSSPKVWAERDALVAQRVRQLGLGPLMGPDWDPETGRRSDADAERVNEFLGEYREGGRVWTISGWALGALCFEEGISTPKGFSTGLWQEGSGSAAWPGVVGSPPGRFRGVDPRWLIDG